MVKVTKLKGGSALREGAIVGLLMGEPTVGHPLIVINNEPLDLKQKVGPRDIPLRQFTTSFVEKVQKDVISGIILAHTRSGSIYCVESVKEENSKEGKDGQKIILPVLWFQDPE